MNCHPSGDAPLQGDASRPHDMDISRHSMANGVACATCHRDRNGARPGQPSGAQLAPASGRHPMIFQGRTPHQLCLQLLDPRQTRDRNVAALIDHVAHDAFVSRAWAPGPGRTPVPIPRADVGRGHASVGRRRRPLPRVAGVAPEMKQRSDSFRRAAPALEN